MVSALEEIPTWLLGILIIGGGTALYVGTLVLLRDRIAKAVREMHNDVAGYVFAVVGVLYALLLGFVILTTWESFGSAADGVNREAASVSALYETSVGLPKSVQPKVRTELRRYASLIVHDEWPAMASGHASAKVDASLNRLYVLYSASGRAGVQDNADSSSLQLLNDVAALRATRVLDAGGSIDSVMWAVVLFGAACMMAFALLFYLEHAGIQIVMMALFGALVLSMIFLLVVLDNPFGGDFHVTSEPFRLALDSMH